MVDVVTTFRPRRGRVVSSVVALAGLVVFGLVAGLIPGWSLGDRLAVFGMGVALALVMWRYASLRCDVLDEGLVVRNLMRTTRVHWAEIEAFTFPDGDPWPKVLLGDHDDLGVMAIQRSDGEFGQQEAVRLAGLIGRGRGLRPPGA